MSNPAGLNLYVIYDHPRDYPQNFVVRRWDTDKPKEVVTLTKTLEEARDALPEGLYRMKRLPGDDPKIVEVWL